MPFPVLSNAGAGGYVRTPTGPLIYQDTFADGARVPILPLDNSRDSTAEAGGTSFKWRFYDTVSGTGTMTQDELVVDHPTYQGAAADRAVNDSFPGCKWLAPDLGGTDMEIRVVVNALANYGIFGPGVRFEAGTAWELAYHVRASGPSAVRLYRQNLARSGNITAAVGNEVILRSEGNDISLWVGANPDPDVDPPAYTETYAPSGTMTQCGIWYSEVIDRPGWFGDFRARAL